MRIRGSKKPTMQDFNRSLCKIMSYEGMSISEAIAQRGYMLKLLSHKRIKSIQSVSGVRTR